MSENCATGLDSEEKRPQFGGRFLTDSDNVFKHNAWDNVEWDEEQQQEAINKVEKNTKTKVTEDNQMKYENDADSFWDGFYSKHQNKFYKDRHWLFTEFPELGGTNSPSKSDINSFESSSTQQVEPQNSGESSSQREPHAEDYPGSGSKFRILEVGCGVGNTVFPVLQTNNDDGMFIYGCDFSSTAIQILQEHHDYDLRRCHAFVCNVSDPESTLPFPEVSLDVIVLIFVLSAIHPEKMQFTIDRLSRYLKPGGMLVLRDYGRYDMAQLRFKDGQCLGDNFYVRKEGTRVYFFTQEDLREMFTKAGLEEVQNIVDRRLQVNRGRQIKMYRVWLQCKYRKPLET